MPKSDTNEAVAIAAALKPTVDEWGRESSRPCVRQKKMTVASLFDTRTRTIGVREAFSANTQNIPCVPGMRGAAVGDPVWVQWLYGDKSTMCVVGPGDYSEFYEGGVNLNILDNGYFRGSGSQAGASRFPINQRGATSYSGSVYGIDRWFGNNANISTEISSGHIVVSATGAISKDQAIWGQRVEIASKYASRVVTLSLMTYQSADVAFAFNIMTTDSNSTNHWLWFSVPKNDGANLYHQTFTLPSDITAMTIWITPDEAMASGNKIHLSAAKLELGAEQTLAYYDLSASAWKVREIPDFTTELLRCQRYQVAMNPYKVGDRHLGWAMASSTTTAYAVIDLPVVIRDRPTAVSPTTWRLRYPDTNYSVTAITCYNAGHTIHMAMTSSSLTKDRMYMVRNVNATDILLLDANM